MPHAPPRKGAQPQSSLWEGGSTLCTPTSGAEWGTCSQDYRKLLSSRVPHSMHVMTGGERPKRRRAHPQYMVEDRLVSTAPLAMVVGGTPHAMR